MIFTEETQAYDNDGVLDQYEFLVGSLLTLGKLTSEDIKPIMDKYRELAGNKGFISVEDDVTDDDIASSAEGSVGNDSVEEDYIDMEE